MVATAGEKMGKHNLQIESLRPFYHKYQAVKDVHLSIPGQQITAFIGPSGCGKSTVLRCLNRMHEMIDGAHVEGTVYLDDENIYAPDVDPRLVRRKIGIIFQHPAVLLTRSIFENIAVGPRLNGINNRSTLHDMVEGSLKAAVLWDEVKDRLDASARMLSGGQQQRLSIARSIAMKPDVILFDEPCAALDPISTSKIEDLLLQLRNDYTIVIVTHNLQQAVRISDKTAFFMIDQQDRNQIGMLVEVNTTDALFTNPQDPRTQDYVYGRMG